MQKVKKPKDISNLKKKSKTKPKEKRLRKQEKDKEESLKEEVEDQSRPSTDIKKVDVFIPQRSVQLEDVSVAEPNEALKELAKSLENIIVSTPATKNSEEEKLNYGPGGKGKFYESGKYQSAKYEEAAKYEPPRLEEPTAEAQGRDYSGMHATDRIFERFIETKKREEEGIKYKKRKH